jgi:myo-inositol-hexaphosphate 3-phosphohydrolase
MSFHPDKCNIMRVIRSKNPILFNYHLKGHQLVAADTTKYLGVDLSHDLWLLISLYTMALSAKSRVLDVTHSGRSFMNIKIIVDPVQMIGEAISIRVSDRK